MENETQTQTTSVQSPSAKNALGIPVAIVIAAALIAGAIIYSGSQKTGAPIQVGDTAQNTQETADIEVAPVTAEDHIKGNPNAPIMIVEYSDFECPFCKNFHETMTKIMAEYGKDGKVAWVYRQFPIQQLHPNAPKIAEASECVAKLGGNDAFWKFADSVFGGRAVNAQTDITKLPEFAVSAGVDKTKYTDCVNTGTYTETIKGDVAAAMKAGAQGTPYSLLIVGDQQGVINGAQPYEVVKQMIDTVIAQTEGN